MKDSEHKTLEELSSEIADYKATLAGYEAELTELGNEILDNRKAAAAAMNMVLVAQIDEQVGGVVELKIKIAGVKAKMDLLDMILNLAKDAHGHEKG